MEASLATAADIAAEIHSLRDRVAQLEAKLRASSDQQRERLSVADAATVNHCEDQPSPPPPPTHPARCGLEPLLVNRYSRQMVVPRFGAPTQLSLQSMSVLIVGAGGLGCPVALYLAGAGIGRIGVVDGDTVELSNLHRQVAHPSSRRGEPKATSLCTAMRDLNGSGAYEAILARLDTHNAMELVQRFDVIVDCTDNPASRYVINDACVLAGRPLVSGAALGTDGQLSVYNFPPQRPGPRVSRCQAKDLGAGEEVPPCLAEGAPAVGHGHGGRRAEEDLPCYRCVFPVPPSGAAAAASGSCADAGIVGPVTGLIGSLQAMEVIKIASHMAAVAAAATGGDAQGGPASPSLSGLGAVLTGKLLVVDAADTRFRVVRLRERSPSCAVCGDAPTITNMEDVGHFLAQYGLSAASPSPAPSGSATPGASLECTRCGAAPVSETPASTAASAVPSVSAAEFARAAATAQGCTGSFGYQSPTFSDRLPCSPHAIILDCRPAPQFEMCFLDGSINVPLRTIVAAPKETLHQLLEHASKHAASIGAREEQGAIAAPSSSSSLPAVTVHVICRRGVDSLEATLILRSLGVDAYNVAGGLAAYSATVDPSFPSY